MSLTPGTVLYERDGWRIMVLDIATNAVLVTFSWGSGIPKIFEWHPICRVWQGSRWRPVGRVPDAVLREVEARLQDQNTTTETAP